MTFDTFEIPAPEVGYTGLVRVSAADNTVIPYDVAFAIGHAAGVLVADVPDDATRVAVFSAKLNGDPLTGTLPTWVAYYNTETGLTQTPPVFSEVGNGSYKFTPSGTSPAGIIDHGELAAPRYSVYAAISFIKVFAAFDEDGEPLPTVTPTWVSLKKASDNTNVAQPAITELGDGLYKTDWLAEHAIGTIDLGGAAFPRYIQYDSETMSGFATGYAEGYADGVEAGVGLVYRMRAFDVTLGRMVYWSSDGEIDAVGLLYLGPGPIIDIVVQAILGGN